MRLYEEKSITSYYYYYIINISDKVIAAKYTSSHSMKKLSLSVIMHTQFFNENFLRSSSLLIRFHRILFSSLLYTSHARSPSRGLQKGYVIIISDVISESWVCFIGSFYRGLYGEG